MRFSKLLNVGLLITLIVLPFRASAQGVTELVGVAFDGSYADDWCDTASISADGRFVAFEADATNIVPDDTNGAQDIFVRDREAGVTVRVSVASDGAEANGWSHEPSISGDGRYIEFSSSASNLVPDDTNDIQDIFIHDMQTGTTKRVSVATDGTEANGKSNDAEISLTGRYVVFTSHATNLGGDSGSYDIFVHDLQTAETSLVTDNSINAAGWGYRASISADGRFVSYQRGIGTCTLPFTDPDNVFVIDRLTNTEELVSSERGTTPDPCFSGGNYASISANGRYVVFMSAGSSVFPGNPNNTADIFVHDRETGLIEQVSVGPNGEQANAGCWPWLYGPSISADGRFVAFQCPASNFVPGDAPNHDDIFVRDLKRGVTEHISVSSDGFHGDRHSQSPRISADGRSVVFMSDATNFLGPDNPFFPRNLWVRERDTTVFSNGFESATNCYWSDNQGGAGCPGQVATGLIHMTRRYDGGWENITENLYGGGTFTLHDGVNPATVFEFDGRGDGVALGNVAVNNTLLNTAEGNLSLLMSVIAATPNLDITPIGIDGTTLYLTNDNIGAAGNHPITETVNDFIISFRGMSGGVDPGP